MTGAFERAYFQESARVANLSHNGVLTIATPHRTQHTGVGGDDGRRLLDDIYLVITSTVVRGTFVSFIVIPPGCILAPKRTPQVVLHVTVVTAVVMQLYRHITAAVPGLLLRAKQARLHATRAAYSVFYGGDRRLLLLPFRCCWISRCRS